MRVVKVGKIPPKQITCQKCESVLEYTQEDVTKRKYSYRGGKCGKHEGYKELITCPICNAEIELGKHETKYISASVINEAAKLGIYLD